MRKDSAFYHDALQRMSEDKGIDTSFILEGQKLIDPILSRIQRRSHHKNFQDKEVSQSLSMWNDYLLDISKVTNKLSFNNNNSSTKAKLNNIGLDFEIPSAF